MLFCISFAAGAQVIDTIYATGALTSYTTGSAIQSFPSGAYTRNDNIIAVTKTPSITYQAGYAVFDLSSIPTGGVVISSVVLGVNVFGFTSGTFGTSCLTIGHTGSLATVTTPASLLYTDCTTLAFGTPTTLFNATSVGMMGTYYLPPTGVGDLTMTGGTGSPIANWVLANAGVSAVSISFSSNGSNVYNFKGETGSTGVIAGPHAPYLMVTYCWTPTSVTASVTPSPICTGQTFTLTGAATGASSYHWTGPGGYSSTLLSTTAIATATSGGVYTLTAMAACGAYTATTTAYTTPLAINPSPAPLITTTTTVCSGNTIYMSDLTAGGVWTTSNSSIATVINGTVVGGAVAGTDVISYKLGICAANATILVNNPPTAITGPTDVCASGGTITLIDGTPGGTWSSTAITLATVDPLSGLVTGILPGSLNINYVTGACPSVTYPITVDPLPTPILGGNAVCVNANLPLSDATAAGTWSSSNTSIATVDPNTGVVTGVSAGSFTTTYTLSATGCYVTRAITVNPLPATITGPTTVCVSFTIALSDATGGGT
ncbi:MAG: Ig-like domain-containing protein, partial [Chitinophagales bacterium]